MPTRSDWIEHRRGDGELVGWVRQQEDAFVAIDLLGRPLTGAVDWLSAEETLDAVGIGYLAEPFELLLDDGSWMRVRITEVSSTHIRVKKEDGGAIGGPRAEHTLPFPPEGRLRPFLVL